MEFEDMQVIWNEQSSEKLYAIDQSALNKMIGKKAKKSIRQVVFFETVLILVNFGTGGWMLYDAIYDDVNPFVFVLAAAYILYAFYTIYQRFGRKTEETRFDNTVLGEVDKAIFRTKYLIQQGYRMYWWYLVPLMIGFSIFMILEQEYLWVLFPAVFVPLMYFGIKWEIRKLHQPRRDSLESIREALLEDPK
ncbi:MAG: hypothetical protein AAF902_24295 [Chloroflexota bacterium]